MSLKHLKAWLTHSLLQLRQNEDRGLAMQLRQIPLTVTMLSIHSEASVTAL